MTKKKEKQWKCFIAGSLVLLLISCFQSFRSDENIIDDWKTYTSSQDYRCNKNIKYTNFKILGKSIERNDAVVRIQVTADWIGAPNDINYMSMLCVVIFYDGRATVPGNNKSAEYEMLYKKYDTGWKLVKINWKQH